MPVIVLKTGTGQVPTLTTGTSIEVCQYSPFQHVPFHAQCRFGLHADVSGVLATIYAGTDLLMPEGPIKVNPTAGALPIFPDDFHLVDTLAAGARLSVLLRNTNAGTAIVPVVIHIDPV